MIKELHLKNWKSFGDTILYIEPVTVLMGLNASGKSNAIDALLADSVSAHIVVVSHVSPIKAAVAWALGVGVEVSWRTALDRASMTTVRLDAKHPALKTFNVTL